MGEKEMKVSRHLWRDKGTIEFSDFSIDLHDRQMYQLRNLLLDLYPVEKKSDRQEEVVDLIGNIENFYWDSKKGPPQNLYNIMTDLKERVATIIDRRIKQLEYNKMIYIKQGAVELHETPIYHDGQINALKNLRRQLVGEKGE